MLRLTAHTAQSYILFSLAKKPPRLINVECIGFPSLCKLSRRQVNSAGLLLLAIHCMYQPTICLSPNPVNSDF